VRLLSVGRVARHQVQADRLPARRIGGLCLRRLADCLRGSLTTRNASPGATQHCGATHQLRCHAPPRCHPPYSASEPNVELLTVRFVTERSGHQVQAGRLLRRSGKVSESRRNFGGGCKYSPQSVFRHRQRNWRPPFCGSGLNWLSRQAVTQPAVGYRPDAADSSDASHRPGGAFQ
jgi:hypothetical protein